MPFGIGLLSFPLSGDSTLSWPGAGKATHPGAGWHAIWLVGLGLLALVVCLAVLGAASRLLVSLAPRVLGPTLIERVGIAAERERVLARANALARDLHDQLGHTLTAMTVQATAARRLLPTDPKAAERALAAVEELGRRAQDVVDGVVRALRDGAQDGIEVSGASDGGPGGDRRRARPRVAAGRRVPRASGVARRPQLRRDRTRRDPRRADQRHTPWHRIGHDSGCTPTNDQCASRSATRSATLAPTAPQRAGLAGLQERVLLADGQITAGPEGGDSWLLTARLPISRPAPIT